MGRETLILVPGLLCTRDLFAPITQALSEAREPRVADTLSDVTIDDMADRLLEGAPERFALAGLSMGGYVALAVARKAPKRLSALILLDTTARPDTEEQTANRRRLVEMAQRSGILSVSKVLREKLLAPENQERADLAERVDAMADEVGTERFLIQQEAIIGRLDSREALRDIRVPTLVIVGAEDRLTPPVLAEEIAAGIANAHLVTIPAAGHMTPLEAPEATAAAMTGFLREV